jgi:hypothetical protein
MPGLRWVAVKVTPHLHGSVEGFWREERPGAGIDPEKDTERYLAAGAVEAFLVEGGGDLGGAGFSASRLAALRGRALGSDALLVESNQAVEGLAGERVISLAVLAGVEAEWKESARALVERADALVLSGGMRVEDLPAELRGKAVFALAAGEWASAGLVEFVRAKLGL